MTQERMFKWLMSRIRKFDYNNFITREGMQFLSTDQDQCIDESRGLSRINKRVRWNEFKMSLCYLLIAYLPVINFIRFGVTLITIVLIVLMAFTSVSNFICTLQS